MPIEGDTSSSVPLGGSNSAQRTAFLDGWLKQRIVEANEIEAKINNRVAYLEKTEAGLRALHDAVRKQVVEALPILDGFNKAKQESEKILDDLVNAKAALEGIFDQQIDEAKAALGRLGELAGQSIEDATKKLNTCQNGMRAIGDMVEERIRTGMDEIFDHAKQAVDPMIERLAQDVERAKARAEHLRQSAEHAVEAQLGSFESALAARSDALRQRMENHAEQSLRGAETAMRQELLRLSEDFSRCGAEVKSEINRLATDLQDAINRETRVSGQMLQQQAGQWIVETERQVDDSAVEIGRQLSKISNNAHEAFETTRKSLEQRLSHLETDIESRLGWISRRIDLRLSELSDRTLKASKSCVQVQLFTEEKPTKVA